MGLVFFMNLWFAGQANADALTLQSSTRQIKPLQAIEIYKDATGKLGLKEILTPAIQANFSSPPTNQEGELNFGFTEATYWIKLTLQRAPQAPDDWILEIPYLSLSQIVFFAPGEQPMRVGTDLSADDKPIFYPLYALPIRLNTEPQSFYLQIRSNYALTVPLMLWSLAAFSREFSDNLLSQAVYFGGLLSLALYNFLLFLSLRDRSYLHYTLFALSLGMAMFAGNGYGRLYLWPDANAWDFVSQTTFFCLAAALSICFTCSFLRVRSSMPVLYRCLQGFAFAYLIAGALLVGSIWGAYSQSPAFQLALVISLPATLCALMAAINAYRAGNSSALYFLLANGALWIGVNVAVLRAFDLLPSNGYTLYAVQIGSCIEMLLLSFALAHRIHAEREQRITAQAATIEARNQLLALAKETESQLENKVVERTQKLQQIALNEKDIRQEYVRFGAMIAHEFRNPLGIIETQATLTKREHELGIDKVCDRSETILSATHRLAKLFDQWLKSDQLQEPISQLHSSPIMLDTLMNSVFQAAQAYHQGFKIVMQHVPAVTVEVDQSLLEIALLNLIDNACKYSRAQDVVDIRFQPQEKRLGITVSDNGPGIPPDLHHQIFKPYVRVGDTKSKSGFGLGLVFVAYIAELHHGSVEVHSEQNQGSQFTLWIPCL